MMHDFQAILSAFFPQEKNVAARPIGSGNINDTYKFVLGNKTYLLQRVNHQVFTNPHTVVNNQAKIWQHLKQKRPSWVVPDLHMSTAGSFLHHDQRGNYWRVLDFIPDSQSVEMAETLEQVAESARMMGQFIAALNEAPIPELAPTIPNFHHLQQRFKQFQQASQMDSHSRRTIVQKEIDWIHLQMRKMPNYHQLNLPQRLVHNDPKIGNVLFNAQGKCICVIDWDTLMPGSILTDFGDMVRTMVTTASEDEAELVKVRVQLDYFHALSTHFLAPLKNLLNPLERKYLPTAPYYIILEQAIRFLADYLAGDVYYKVDYSTHNLVRARNQIHLYQQLRASEHEIKRIIQEALQ